MSLFPVAVRAADRDPTEGVESRQFFLLKSADTGGQLALSEGVVHPGQVPPPHVHHNEDEAFYVLAGELTIQAGETRYRATAGTIVWLPREIPHGIAVETDEARVLNLLAPAGLEEFLQQIAGLMSDPTSFQAKRRELMAQYGIEDVPLPPTRPSSSSKPASAS
ncbi:MAG TPA: cupin domain-containing protein [Chloroflexota bacterium]|nr:cupin domain-containing protein [Chloroflexota bacterium]